MSTPTIWIDGDGAPGACKQIIYKASQRTKTPVILVANRYQEVPRFSWIQGVVVSGGLDVADDYIAEHCQPGDLVITSDIPLAARIIEAGATVPYVLTGEPIDLAPGDYTAKAWVAADGAENVVVVWTITVSP